MHINSLLTDQEKLAAQESLFQYFRNNRTFEEFIKYYLHKMSLDEVTVAQRLQHGTVDFTAIRAGIGGFSDVDATQYYIRGSKDKLKYKITATNIQELKDAMPLGAKGIFITTSSFTAKARAEAKSDPSKPVVLIDGNMLVASCIDHNIGFSLQPVFSRERMDLLLNNSNQTPAPEEDQPVIEKLITKNDIRARIISIPAAIMSQISEDQATANVVVNGDEQYELSINRDRNYLGGVTKLLKTHRLLTNDGITAAKLCQWTYDSDQNLISLRIMEPCLAV